jgi:hypothetical protein
LEKEFFKMALPFMKFIELDASGVVSDEPCYVSGIHIGVDEVNDPTITLYDNPAAAAGDKIMPTTKFDAAALGINGFEKALAVYCPNGCYYELSIGAGACESTVFYREAKHLKNHWI